MTQSANRNSLIGWVKNLKRNALLNDSVNEIEQEDISTLGLRSPTHLNFISSPTLSQPIAFPSLSPRNGGIWPTANPDLLRPLLRHKSRSANNVNNRERLVSNSGGSPLPESSFNEIKQHRDSFLQSNLLIDKNSQYFGVPLAQAVQEASARISILGSTCSETNDNSTLHYGRIPIVVAKCGIYLKTSGLNIEGIFRVAGSSKRIKELQIVFNTPPLFGKKLDWEGYTVHDAASVLRRYLNALPEPLIILDLYEEFRDVLCKKPRIIKYLKYKAENPREVRNEIASSRLLPSSEATTPVATTTENNDPLLDVSISTQEQDILLGERPKKDSQLPVVSSDREKLKSYKKLTRDIYAAISQYRELLDLLPDLSKQLLFYILDLLAMVQNYSLENLMSARNLAAIFQPSILLHPDHDMDPEEYALSQSVVEFLIQYAFKILPSGEDSSRSSKTAHQAKDTSPNIDVASSTSLKRHHSNSSFAAAENSEILGGKDKPTEFEPHDAGLPDGTSEEDILHENINRASTSGDNTTPGKV